MMKALCFIQGAFLVPFGDRFNSAAFNYRVRWDGVKRVMVCHGGFVFG